MPSARGRAYRTVAGFVIAPMMPALILAGVVLVAGGDSQTLGYAAFAGYVSYPFALLVGLPSFLLMRGKRWDGLRAYVLAGLVLGLIFLALFAGLAGFEGDAANSALLNLLANLAFLLPFVLACALASTVVFWFIARPDLYQD
jgi:glycopeptide antibiotics resistance protein